MSTTRSNHEIDYKIYGEELQFVEIELDPSETAVAESGAMMMMDDGIQMQTIFGDGSTQQVPLLCRIDTLDELEYYRNGGILHYVLRKLAA